jgi:hypothetical protein
MSTIQTNAIVDAAGGNTASVNGVTPNTHSVRGRNLIINGDMRVAQRGTSFTSSGSGLFTLDRWVSGVHTGTGDGDMTQETDAPTAVQSGTNFTHSLKFQVTTANTSIQATDRKYHVYRIEGQDLAPAGFGQAGTRYMTLSFWHKHTKTGIHSLAINNAARNRSYPMEYTQTTTNTWEKAELTFPVDTTGTWLGGNGIGMWIFFGAAFGSNYAATVNQWGAGQKYGTANQVNNYDSTSNSMQFTGVQLELGSVATEFDHRSYAEELLLCQRYYERIEAGASSSYVGFSAGTIYGSGTYLGHFTSSVPMRVTPTFSTDAYGGASKMSVVSGANTYDVTSIVVTGINQRLRINAAGALSGIIGQGAYIQIQNGYHVAFTAEL